MAMLAAQKVSEKTMREDQALVQEDIARNIWTVCREVHDTKSQQYAWSSKSVDECELTKDSHICELLGCGNYPAPRSRSQNQLTMPLVCSLFPVVALTFPNDVHCRPREPFRHVENGHVFLISCNFVFQPLCELSPKSDGRIDACAIERLPLVLLFETGWEMPSDMVWKTPQP